MGVIVSNIPTTSIGTVILDEKTVHTGINHPTSRISESKILNPCFILETVLVAVTYEVYSRSLSLSYDPEP